MTLHYENNDVQAYDAFAMIEEGMKATIDIIVVTFNSERWIDGLIKSLFEAEHDFCVFNLIFVDNCSDDATLAMLYEYQKRYDFEIVEMEENRGFGTANNVGVRQGSSEFVFFLNVDTEVLGNTLDLLAKAILCADAYFAAFELKQMPYEHPKYYDPITQEVSWASGAALVVRRDVFEKVGGFDEAIFMYVEDVDLSWRIRDLGYGIKYLFDCGIMHYSYKSEFEVKPLQFVHSLKNNLLLRYRYGSVLEIVKGYLLILGLFTRPENIENQAGELKKILKESFEKGMAFRGGVRKRFSIKPQFYGFDYERVRDGAFLKTAGDVLEADSAPLVSVIVRTHARRDVLREALISLRRQTYANFEVIVCEDGEATAEKMVRDEFADLRMVYLATGRQQGRSEVANQGLRWAKGDLINFLDDDDVFYPDHLEVLVREFLKDPTLEVVHATSFETPIRVLSKVPYDYAVEEIFIRYRQAFSENLLLVANQFPIQSVMFKKKLFEERGGFERRYDFLEDWDFWLKIMKDVRFCFVEKTTSIYRVPADREINHVRRKMLDENYHAIQEEHLKRYYFSAFEGDLIDEESFDLSMIVFYLSKRKHLIHMAGTYRKMCDEDALMDPYFLFRYDGDAYVKKMDLFREGVFEIRTFFPKELFDCLHEVVILDKDERGDFHVVGTVGLNFSKQVRYFLREKVRYYKEIAYKILHRLYYMVMG